jgi:hypothetical protein
MMQEKIICKRSTSADISSYNGQLPQTNQNTTVINENAPHHHVMKSSARSNERRI